MAKRLRVRDKILFGLAILGDLYFEVFEPFSVQIGKMKGVLPPDYKASNFSGAVSKLLKTGNIEKVIKNGKPYWRFTGKGAKSLKRDFPIFSLQKKRWDGLWRIVFYDIPEENKPLRERLQAKLKELGFGALQESVYITPHDVAEDLHEFLVEQNLSDFVFVSVSKQLFAKKDNTLAGEIWRLEDLNNKYQELYQKIRNQERLDEIFDQYWEILKDDPCLPKELLPRDWLGDKVHLEVKKLLKSGSS